MTTKEKRRAKGIYWTNWSPVIGCDPAMSCSPHCWARKTVLRFARNAKTFGKDMCRDFMIALEADDYWNFTGKWSGKSVLIYQWRLLDGMTHDALAWENGT